jgi:predicted GH43/DUF377 family glycosyl hydrolase
MFGSKTRKGVIALAIAILLAVGMFTFLISTLQVKATALNCGNTVVEPDSAYFDAWWAFEYNVPYGGTITSITVYFTTIAGSCHVGIYNDTGLDYPASLLVETGAWTPSGSGWQTITVTSTNFSAGKIWIVFGASSSSMEIAFDTVQNEALKGISDSGATYGSMPATFSSSKPIQTDDASIYFTYTVSSASASVVLVSPPNGSNALTTNVTFQYIPSNFTGIQSASLWMNLSGTWQSVANNVSAVISGATNNISYSPPVEATYVWNVGVLNATAIAFGPANYTLLYYTSVNVWTEYSGNPILQADANGLSAWGSVFYNGSSYLMYYSYYTTTGLSIGLATSANGETGWTKYANNPIMVGTSGYWDAGGCWCPMVWIENGVYYMTYTGWPVAWTTAHSIGLATSTDGINWTKKGVILSPGASGAWDQYGVEGWGVMKTNGTYYLWYDTMENAGNTRSVGLATTNVSPSLWNASSFVKDPNNPIFGSLTFSAFPFQRNGYYYLLVAHSSSDLYTDTSIELYSCLNPTFYSADREYLGVVLSLNSSGWDSNDLDTPFVLTDDISRSSFQASNNQLWCYYSGKSNSSIWQEGMTIETNIDNALGAHPLPPSFGSITVSNTVAGSPVQLSCLVNSPVNVSCYVYSWNNTGSWTNQTATPFTSFINSTAAYATLTGTWNTVAGNTVSAIVYANDTSNNWNASSQYNFTITSASASTLVFTAGAGQSLTAGELSSSITVQRQDQYGNPVTVGSLTVSLSSTSGNATFYSDAGTTPATSVVISNGFSTVSFWYNDTYQGLPTLSASSQGLNSATTIFTITSSSVSKLVFTTGTGQSLPAGQLSAQITVQRLDQYGNPVTSGSITVSLNSTSPAGVFYSDTGGTVPIGSVTITNGSSTVSFWYKDTAVGSPTLTVSSTGSASSNSAFTITSAPAFKLVFTAGTNQSLTAGQLSSSITVQRQDQYGNLVTSGFLTVTLNSTSLGATFYSDAGVTPATSVTINNGSSMVSFWYVDTVAGSPVLTTSASDLTSAITTFTITSTNASKLVFTAGLGQYLSAGQLSGQITVQRLDQYGNPVTSGSITVTLNSTSLGATFYSDAGTTPATSVVIVNGSSTVSFWYVDTIAGSPVLTASASGLTSGGTIFVIASASASKLVFTAGAGQSLNAGQVSSVITVQRFDQYGNPATSGNITVYLSSSSGTGIFFSDSGGTHQITQVTIFSGSSSASFYYNDTAAGTPTLTASSSGLNSATTQFTINAATASRLVYTAGGGQTLPAGTLSAQITIQRLDQYGNPVTSGSLTVNLNSTSLGATFYSDAGTTPATSVVIVNGSSTVSFWYKDTVVGSPTLTASAVGLSSATTTFVITSASLDHFTVTAISNPQTAGTTFNITITAVDQYGNTVTSYNGSNTLSDLSGTISPTTTSSFSTGVWTGSVTITKAFSGDTISTLGSGKSGTTNSFNVIPGAFDHFTMTSYPSSTVTGQTFNITVTAWDTFGNVETGYAGQVYFTSSDTQAVLPYTIGSKYTFTPGDNGIHTFTGFELNTVPMQTINVTDGVKSATTGSITVMLPITAPSYSGISVSTTLAGQSCTFYSAWNDNYGLSGYIFSTNNTGTWQNTTWTPFPSTPALVSVTQTLNSNVGVEIDYIWYANNTNGLWNNTGILTLTTTGGAISAAFSVISNSTVSQLAFNSTTEILEFTVSGPAGTTGFTNVTIVKTLISNVSALEVYLDGNQINYTVTDLTTAWLISFTYHHSTHRIVMEFAPQQTRTTPHTSSNEDEVFLAIIGPAIIISAMLAITIQRKRKSRNSAKRKP